MKKDLENSDILGTIVGRSREKLLLKDLLESKKSEFIAIYGRRRVGKTYLIKNYVNSFSYVFFHVTGIQKGTLQSQLDEFAKQIGEAFYQGASIVSRSSWKDAFEDLTQAIKKISKTKKVVLFFDELPWMATPRSKLLTSLELYWNLYWVWDLRLKLIICGSATSWIIENIINDTGGLHNRVTRTIKILPFTLCEVENYLKEKKINLSRRHILDLYITFGGIPLYWSFIRKGYSASQSIDELCFQNDGPLFKEFKRLFDSLFKDPKPYVDLIRTIAKYRYGIGQIDLIKKSKLPLGGRTVRRLEELEECGFILSLVPYGRKEKGVYYLVDDEYCLFYLYWIESNSRIISKKAINKGYWVSLSKEQAWKSWVGYAFESICYKHTDHIRSSLNIDPRALAGTWRYRPKPKSDQDGTQIDLLFDRHDDVITICEIKYSDKPFAIDKSYAKNLLKKMEIFKEQTKTKKQLFLSMITTCGLKETMYSEEIVDSQATLDGLFKEIE